MIITKNYNPHTMERKEIKRNIEKLVYERRYKMIRNLIGLNCMWANMWKKFADYAICFGGLRRFYDYV